jgi:hypothetical protein
MKQPGYDFEAIAKLVYDHNWQLPTVFTDELLLSIFWEETQFNNIRQLKGTAVGFGQLEPAELWTLKPYGVITNAKNILNDPAHSVEVTSYFLRHLHESQKASPKSRGEALKRYAGYYFDHAAWRLKIIAGWEACERALQAINGSWRDNADAVMNALSQSRGFDKSDPAMRGALFPA